MDTNLIRQFCGVFESGTISQAALALHMTPGALSRAIKRLEDEMGVSLFIPSGRNIVPTPEAHVFYGHGKSILKSIEDSKKSVKNLKQVSAPIRIASFEIFSTHFLAHFIAGEKMNTQISVLERAPEAIERSILENHADVGITYIPALHPDLEHIEIGKMELGVFTRSTATASSLPFAIPTVELGENILSVNSLDGWPADFPREIRYRVQQLETAVDLASRGMCKICCPKFLVRIENERLASSFRLKETPSPQGLRLPRLKVYLVKRKSDAESPLFKKLGSALRKALEIRST